MLGSGIARTLPSKFSVSTSLFGSDAPVRFWSESKNWYVAENVPGVVVSNLNVYAWPPPAALAAKLVKRSFPACRNSLAVLPGRLLIPVVSTSVSRSMAAVKLGVLITLNTSKKLSTQPPLNP